MRALAPVLAVALFAGPALAEPVSIGCPADAPIVTLMVDTAPPAPELMAGGLSAPADVWEGDGTLVLVAYLTDEISAEILMFQSGGAIARIADEVAGQTDAHAAECGAVFDRLYEPLSAIAMEAQ
ncbi:hypothetical protein ACXN5S_04870 [Pseudoroseicyclus sp. H15]